MDGQIGVRSTPAVGSVFWLELPLVRSAPAPSQDPVTAEHSIERQLHVLVVDDIATNRELLRTMLSRMGDVAVLAVNGVEAIAAVQRAPFDVVLMDVNMPDMDGLEATRHIRALEGRAGRIPILALTAGATEADKARTRDAGMNAHITKPVGRAKLAEALAPLRG